MMMAGQVVVIILILFSANIMEYLGLEYLGMEYLGIEIPEMLKSF